MIERVIHLQRSGLIDPRFLTLAFELILTESHN
jgi:hypothetical protein